MKYLSLILSLFLICCNKENNNPPNEDEVPINQVETLEYNQIDGVDPNLLSLDIYYKSSIEEKKPIVIYVHGGGWSIGDKSSQIENKVSLFHSLNYVFVSVNYRLSPFPYELNNPDRILFPTHNLDVADAIKWVVDNIDAYGGDSNKIALLGHSAGAHLVALTGTNASFLNNVGLSFADITAIATIDTEGYDVVSKVQENNDLYINAFGTDSALNSQASPILNITNNTSYPNFFVAKRGNENRIGIANDFISTLEQNGAIVAQVDGSIYSHSEINEAIGLPGETLITDALKQFLEDSFQ